jgi:hypothetical protein
LKAGESLWVASDFFGQEFERDETVQPRVFGFVNHSHPTATDFLDNSIVGNGLAQHESGDGVKRVG